MTEAETKEAAEVMSAVIWKDGKATNLEGKPRNEPGEWERLDFPSWNHAHFRYRIIKPPYIYYCNLYPGGTGNFTKSVSGCRADDDSQYSINRMKITFYSDRQEVELIGLEADE
jgi:hypothetical protein